MLDGWAQRGLLDSTLVVVVGDHGEAFGQHANMAHRYLYEEEVRVPLVMINRRLFHGETDDVPGGLIDLAPDGHGSARVFDSGGVAGPFAVRTRPPARVYLFGPYSGLFGYREGTRKLIYDAIGDETELYDLALDPRETSNLALQHPALARGRSRAAGRMGPVSGPLLPASAAWAGPSP